MANLIQLPSPLDPAGSKLLIALREKITSGLPPEQHLNAALKYGMMYKLNYETLLIESKSTNSLHTNLEIQKYKEKVAELKDQVDSNRKMANEFQFMEEMFTNATASLKALNLEIVGYKSKIEELKTQIITLQAPKTPSPAPDQSASVPSIKATPIGLTYPLSPEQISILNQIRAKIVNDYPADRQLSAALQYILIYKTNFERVVNESTPAAALASSIEINRLQAKLADVIEVGKGYQRKLEKQMHSTEALSQSILSNKTLLREKEEDAQRIANLKDHIVTLQRSKIPLPGHEILKAEAEPKKDEPAPEDPANPPQAQTQKISYEELKLVEDALKKVELEMKNSVQIDVFNQVIHSVDNSIEEHNARFTKVELSISPLISKIAEMEEGLLYFNDRDISTKKDVSALQKELIRVEQKVKSSVTHMEQQMATTATSVDTMNKNLSQIDLFNEHLQTLEVQKKMDRILNATKNVETAYTSRFDEAVKRSNDKLAEIIKRSEDKLAAIALVETQLNFAFEGLKNLKGKIEKTKSSKKSNYSSRQRNMATQHYVDVLRNREINTRNEVLGDREKSESVVAILLNSDWEKHVSEKYPADTLLEWSQEAFLSPTEKKPYTDKMTTDQWDWQKNVNWRLHYRNAVVSRV
jgi:citrate synthase